MELRFRLAKFGVSWDDCMQPHAICVLFVYIHVVMNLQLCGLKVELLFYILCGLKVELLSHIHSMVSTSFYTYPSSPNTTPQSAIVNY